MSDALARARTALDRQAWAEARTYFLEARATTPLSAGDSDGLGIAAYLVGDDVTTLDARSRAYQQHLDEGQPVRAAGSALWLAVYLLERRDRQSEASGWIERVRRLLDDNPGESFEHGFRLCLQARLKMRDGDFTAALALFVAAVEIGTRTGDRDLASFARHGQGRTLMWLGRTGEGLAMLDDVMLSVTAGELTPMVTGIVYCSVISACHDLFDLRRAGEWTSALAAWCAEHPDMHAFRGECLIRRSELLQLHGAWEAAADEVERACARLSDPEFATSAGGAFYQQAELWRVRGDFTRAEHAYRSASRAGRTPQPGLALLRLAQGDPDAAASSIRSALPQAQTTRARASMLRAAVDVLLAAGDPDAAREAAAELQTISASSGAPFLRAIAAQAAGVVALADGDAVAAAAALRDAWGEWRELDAPYEIARVRTLLGLAYRALGDEEGARLEFEAAQESFEQLGAAPDVARLGRLMTSAVQASGGLTGREVEVLRLVASGRTNRAIAEGLGISEKTVARHVSNIFTKLDLSSRSAATAYAYEHKLLTPST